MRLSQTLHTTLAVTLLAASSACLAAEGMWTLDNLPVDRIAKEYGFRPDPDWSKRVMRSSVRLAGGCSGSFISADGLVLTNHHCGVGCVEDLSTSAKDYVKTGFIAKSRSEEIQCPGVELNRLEEITDVSDQVKKTLAGLNGEAYVQAQRAITSRLTAACAAGDPQRQRCDLVNLYHGGRYHLYRYHRFQDARLVFVPEKDIAFFGGDPDNFNFPRYDLDMALLRVYEDGKPAAIKDFFKVAAGGAAVGELVFVTGHPGGTNRQLTLAELGVERDIDVTDRLINLAEVRGLLTEYGKTSPEAARVSTTDLFSVENGFKALKGRLKALQDPSLWQTKQQEEKRLQEWVRKNDRKGGDYWESIARAQDTWREIATEFNSLEKAQGFRSRYFTLARILVRGADQRAKPDAERFAEYSDSALPRQEQLLFSSAPIYPDYERAKLTWSLTKLRELLGADDERVKRVLGTMSPAQLAAQLIAGTRLADVGYRRQLWAGGQAAIAASDDPMIILARQIEPHALSVRKRHEAEVEAVVRKSTERISAARFAMSGTSTYPDATFTLRLSYGDVRGWKDGAKEIGPFTNFDGLYHRATGVDPFALPDSWLKARSKLAPGQPFNFVTTNDIIGGNSGSPVINSRREVVGLIFDGNLPSLGGDYWYDIRMNRAVAVHSGAIIQALQNVYGANELVKEIQAP
jgi:hypothetical protein